MREIKFRGQDGKGKWHYGDLLNLQSGNYCITDKNINVNYAVFTHTIGQFTGMRDRNGKEVYDGDIIKIHDELVYGSNTECGYEYDSTPVKTYALIEWSEDECAFRITRTNLGEYECESQFLYDVSPDGNGEKITSNVRYTEVVGNVYDNPELLEEE